MLWIQVRWIYFRSFQIKLFPQTHITFTHPTPHIHTHTHTHIIARCWHECAMTESHWCSCELQVVSSHMVYGSQKVCQKKMWCCRETESWVKIISKLAKRILCIAQGDAREFHVWKNSVTSYTHTLTLILIPHPNPNPNAEPKHKPNSYPKW